MKYLRIIPDKKYGTLLPSRVPLAIVEAHEKQALINHSQTVMRLAERGGLDPAELLAVLTDQHWKTMYKADPDMIVGRLLKILDDLYVCTGCKEVYHRPVGSVVLMPGDVTLYLCPECTKDGD